MRASYIIRLKFEFKLHHCA